MIREASQASVFRNIQTPEWSSDREERIPVKGVRKAIATAMVQSAFTAPHVSVFVDVDATPHHGVRQAAQELARLRRREGVAPFSSWPRR